MHPTVARRGQRHLARLAFALSLLLVPFASQAAAHNFDHPAPGFSAEAPVGTGLNAGGEGAHWRLLTTFPTGNPHTDVDYFTQGGETYMAAGTLAIGPNGGGQTIIRLTEDGEITATSPEFVAAHPSAACPSDPAAALGLQHDVEATPKGDVIFNTLAPSASRGDAQLLLDATDNEGRCHDGGPGMGLGATDPQGGIEIVDITDVEKPAEIGLTSHIGEAHTVNVDPKRPHIAFAVSSDSVSVTCNADDTSCARANENPSSTQRFNLDGFELIDLSSCMNLGGLGILEKRGACRPTVYRYRYPSELMALGHTQDALAGCHELEIYPDDRLTCASINATMLFDLSGAFDDNGTPGYYLDDRPVGTPLPCRVRPSSSAVFITGAKVTDCVYDNTGAELTIPRWIELGRPSLGGVEFLGAAFHHGRGGPYPSSEDVDVSHEAEITGSGRLILATDERGGGVTPPGATCAPGVDNPQGNGGIHAYGIDALLPSSPSGPDTAAAQQAWTSYAQTPQGGKAVYRAPIRTGPQATLCTAHVFHQIPGQNRIFMGWYSQGTRVVDFVEHPDGTVSFSEAGWFIPENANTWTSAIFKMRRNDDGSYTYWGATGDFNLGAAGRSAMDVYEVTLPGPPRPLGVGGEGDAAEGDGAKGSGWLFDRSGKKINFGFSVRQAAGGPQGTLQLHDKGAAPAGAKIDVKTIRSIGSVQAPCGSVTPSAAALQFRGSGTYNGSQATFRVCVEDGGERGSDRFYLECSCGYTTSGRAPDDVVDGGNVHVRRAADADPGGAAAPTTVILDPVLGKEGATESQLLTVRIYDQRQEPISGASVTLTRSTESGTETFTLVSGLAGTATLTVPALTGLAEYTASSGGVSSNTVSIQGLG